jgi:hypothetical protein
MAQMFDHDSTISSSGQPSAGDAALSSWVDNPSEDRPRLVCLQFAPGTTSAFELWHATGLAGAGTIRKKTIEGGGQLTAGSWWGIYSFMIQPGGSFNFSPVADQASDLEAYVSVSGHDF